MPGYGLAEQRRNLVSNPSFETNATGWSGFASSINRSTTRAWVGTSSGLITFGAGSPVTRGAGTTLTGLAVGATYTVSAYLWVPAASAAANPSVWITEVGPVTLAVGASTDQWVRVSGSWTA